MAFIKFTEVGKSFKPKISISPRGLISFSDGCRRKFQMEKYAYCVLYYDKEESKIGVELTNNENADGIIKMRMRQTGADIAARSFLDYFEINVQNTTMYDVRDGEESNWIIVDLRAGRERKNTDSEEEQQ